MPRQHRPGNDSGRGEGWGFREVSSSSCGRRSLVPDSMTGSPNMALQHNIIQLSQMLRLELRRLRQLVPHVAPSSKRAKLPSQHCIRYSDD